MCYLQYPKPLRSSLCKRIWSHNCSEGCVIVVLKCICYKPPVMWHIFGNLSLILRKLSSTLLYTHNLLFLFRSVEIYFILVGEGSIYFLFIFYIFFCNTVISELNIGVKHFTHTTECSPKTQTLYIEPEMESDFWAAGCRRTLFIVNFNC